VKNERGFALVITLIITALLVALIITFVDEVYVDTSLSKNFVAGQQASLLANSGVDGGIGLLRFSLANQDYSSLNDYWAKPILLEDEQGSLSISIGDESGKLNLNSVAGANGEFNATYHPMAERLLKKLTLPAELCEAVADWIDTNDTPKPGGAESNYYATMKPPYQAKNGSLETVAELALVKGFIANNSTVKGGSESPLSKLRPFVTVYGAEMAEPTSKININTASEEVIAALDERITDDLVKRIVEYRKTTPFKNPAELARVAGMEVIATRLTTVLTVKGAVYRIRAEARVRGISRITEAVVRVSGLQQPMVLYWREY
jgi:general secretion pathway protein K